MARWNVLCFTMPNTMIHRLSLLAVLASLAVPSGLRAQYRWHILQPDGTDTFYNYITNVSCVGENCSAIGLMDSNLIFHSTDGGLTWITVGSIPQWLYYPQGKISLRFYKVQQIDLYDAIAGDVESGTILQTFDGWKTWRQSIFPLDTVSGRGYYRPLYDVDFSNAAEGMVYSGFGFYASTVDTGRDWKTVINHSAISFHSYGNGMFRLFAPPQFSNSGLLYTTHNNWGTADTTDITLNGPFLDANVSPYNLIFGDGDTLAIPGTRWDSTHTHLATMMALSSDLGANWSELPLPPNIGISNPSVTPIDQQTIVIYGVDSIGRILMSTDHGVSWQADTVPLENGMPYFRITSVAVTGSGRVLAVIEHDSNSYPGSYMLAYLEPVPSSVKVVASSQADFSIFPNPATTSLALTDAYAGNTIHLFDILGREALSGKVPASGTLTLDVSRLPRGIYMIMLGEHGKMVLAGQVVLTGE